jgi:transcriptional regulator with XRE-family HTH domain
MQSNVANPLPGVQALGKRIRLARQAQGLSLAALADQAEVGLQTLLRIENGAEGSAIANVEKVMHALGLELEVPFDAPTSGLPLRELHIDSANVDEALEEATRAALAVLDALIATSTPEHDGITSNFQGQLKAHLSAMLCGQSGATQQVALPVLLYSGTCVGGPRRGPDRNAGWVLALQGTDKVLQDGKLLSLRDEDLDPWSSRAAALEAVRLWVERYGHLPGPVEAVPLAVDADGRYRFAR